MWCRGGRRGDRKSYWSAREDTRPYTLRAIDMNDLALVWPILRDLINQSGARGASRALEAMALSQGIFRG
jgi:hypothetical protein